VNASDRATAVVAVFSRWPRSFEGHLQGTGLFCNQDNPKRERGLESGAGI